jgi:glutaredoxin-like protein
MTESKVTVYGAYWCPDCRRAKKFLGEQFVPYKWVDIEQDKEGEKYVLQKNDGKRIIPTIVFDDDSFLVEPSNAELAKKLGLKTEAKKTYYDLIIIGGGPAGLTAAIYASREGSDVLLIERITFQVSPKASVDRNFQNASLNRRAVSAWKYCRLWMSRKWKWRRVITRSILQMGSIITRLPS